MASSATCFSLFFLLAIFLFSSCIHARKGKFTVPRVPYIKDPSLFNYPVSENSHGFYGRGTTDHFPPAKETVASDTASSITAVENELLNEDGESFDEVQKGYNYEDNHSRHGYGYGYYGESSKFNNNGHVTNYENGGYMTGKQQLGMSETRAVENGRYGYGEYESEGKRSSSNGVGGDDKSPFEFDTMEEYEKQEEHRRGRKGYWP